MPLPPPCSVFALLDDALACDQAPEHPASRLYTGHLHTHRCHQPADLDAVCAAVQADLAEGRHGVLLADFEWGAHLQDPHAPLPPGAALQVLVFAQLTRLDEAGVQAFLQREHGHGRAGGLGVADTPPPAGVLHLQPDERAEQTEAAVRQIQAAIRDGAVYQVNHTHRLQGRAYGPPAALYQRLRARQRVGHGAFIALPPGVPGVPGAAGPGAPHPPTHVLSASPELFLHLQGRQLTARPMKGTTPRGNNAAEDAALAQALAQDVKNRAENLMIVDLLRNDLGRVAETGSVQVPRLFAVEPYATVQQMTSTVQARLRAGVGLAELLRATFPCGSITGAPKHAALAQIRRLERQPRGLYCGAIGWLAPCPAPAPAPAPATATDSASASAHAAAAAHPLGELCLSVAIRTLVLGAEAPDGTRPLTAGVGAGIVQDSVPADELAECRLKARFLTSIDPGLGLFETLKVARPAAGAAPQALARPQHLARLARSAQALGFAWASAAAQALLDQALHSLHAGGQPGPWRLRLDLDADGALRCTSAVLPPLATDAQGRVRLGWCTTVLPTGHALAAHKSTHRAHYDAAVRQAEARGCFDLLLANRAGRVVEGGRSSLFVCLDGAWHTPPLADGALPGICRAQVLAQGLPPPPAQHGARAVAGPWAAGTAVSERPLHVAEVQRAQAWAVGNALRGVVPALLAG